MTKRMKRSRRREKRTKRHHPSFAPISAKPPPKPPEPILVEPAPLINPALRWFVVQTFPAYEARVNIALHGRRIETFLPRERIRRIRRQKVYTTTRHLLPRHLFVGLAPGQDAREITADIQGVYDVLRINGRDVQIGAASLQAFAWSLADVAEPLQGNGNDLIRNGDTVIVIDGPFMSFTAVVTGPAPDGKVQAEVMIFGRTSPCDFDLAQLRAA